MTFAVGVEIAVVGAGEEAGMVVVVEAVVGDPEESAGRRERGVHSVPNLQGRVLVDPCRILAGVFS